ncbi:MAG: stage II sporulation protein M [Myxococcota bacterium]|nr:stage II sporulation protein M [Myxococcota bacterium]
MTAHDERSELEHFETLLERAERLRVRNLPFRDLRELARLYRRQTARLARLRQRGDDPEALRYLNALCVRAYAHLGVAPPEPARSGSLLGEIARALARTGWAQALAWLLLAVGVYVGATLSAADPRAVQALVPASLGYGPGHLDRLLDSPEARAEFLARDETPFVSNFLFGSQLFVHNTRVGLLAFAAGILAGLPTVLLGVYNGLMLGAFGAIFLRPPLQIEFLAWILPHGVPELTAIALCVAAGLVLGRAVAAPGRRERRVALREAAESALLLFGAAIPLFFAAAWIESFVRESALGTGVRLAVAGAMLALVLALLAATRRAMRRHPGDAAWLREIS